MSNTSPDMGTEATDTGDDPATGDLAADLATVMSDLGLNPGQLAERLRASRKWEDLAKEKTQTMRDLRAKEKELETIKQSSMSDMDKAVNASYEKGRVEARRESAMERVEDAVRAAAAGRPVDVDALLEGLDTSRFATDDGEPDRKAIVAWVDRIAPPQDEQSQSLDLGQGVRSTSLASGSGDPLLRDLMKKLSN